MELEELIRRLREGGIGIGKLARGADVDYKTVKRLLSAERVREASARQVLACINRLLGLQLKIQEIKGIQILPSALSSAVQPEVSAN